jgi:hypothetical protein
MEFSGRVGNSRETAFSSAKCGNTKITDISRRGSQSALINKEKSVEAGSGIEPLYEDLQSSA